MPSFDICRDDLISVNSAASNERISLPKLLARLGNGEDLEFTAMRPHQQHAWHAFLVQLAALALNRSGTRALKRSPEEWTQLLLELAGQAGEHAWSLVVEDFSLPAFFQPPIPEGTLSSFKGPCLHPDDLDVVISAKNHDVKTARMALSEPEHWLFTLISLQTMEGFLGRGNYGIARMNGGFSSRPCVGWASGLGSASRFRHDVLTLMNVRVELIESYGYRNNQGHSLLWLLPWDGKTSRSLLQCDPFFIEVCRRVRLQLEGGQIVSWRAPTKNSFLEAKVARGATGDIWTPIKTDRSGPQALTVGAGGFSYRLLTDILFSGNFQGNPALSLMNIGDPKSLLIGQVLVRGQGTTSGYHERILPIPTVIRQKLMSKTESERLAVVAKKRVMRASETQRRVLRPAICALLQGGADKLDLSDPRAQPWIDRLDAAVDDVFFDDLWQAAESPAINELEAEQLWDVRLHQLALDQFQDAVAAAPIPLAQKPKAEARAELVFRGSARKNLPGAFTDRANTEEVK